MKRVLCVWLPEWPIQRRVVAQPELSSVPLVLHQRDPRRGQQVVGCNSLARRYGVELGMPLAEVAALQRRTRQPPARYNTDEYALALCEAEPERDRAELERLAVWGERFSPIVGLENDAFPECLLFDMTGLAGLFGGEQRLQALVTEAFERRGYRVQVAFADTVGAAWALAHYDVEEEDGCKSAIEEDAGGSPNASLEALPVAALRLTEESVFTLQQLGVNTIGQLMALPRDGLAARLGDGLLRRLDQCTGRQAELIEAYRPLPEFAARWELEHATAQRHVVAKVLQELTGRVAHQLCAQDHAAVQAEAVLRGESSEVVLQVSLFQPSSRSEHLDELFHLRLETVRLREPVKEVEVKAVTVVRVTGSQQSLWQEWGTARQRGLGLLVDRLRSRLGDAAVFGVRPQAGALPERAYRKQAFRFPEKRETSPPPGVPRPLWMCEPQRIQVLTLRRRESSGGREVPDAFVWGGVRYEVLHCWGPERIETGWWRGPSVRRDYFRIETRRGCRFWLFRRLQDRAWFLHGSFD